MKRITKIYEYDLSQTIDWSEKNNVEEDEKKQILMRYIFQCIIKDDCKKFDKNIQTQIANKKIKNEASRELSTANETYQDDIDSINKAKILEKQNKFVNNQIQFETFNFQSNNIRDDMLPNKYIPKQVYEHANNKIKSEIINTNSNDTQDDMLPSNNIPEQMYQHANNKIKSEIVNTNSTSILNKRPPSINIPEYMDQHTNKRKKKLNHEDEMYILNEKKNLAQDVQFLNRSEDVLNILNKVSNLKAREELKSTLSYLIDQYKLIVKDQYTEDQEGSIIINFTYSLNKEFGSLQLRLYINEQEIDRAIYIQECKYNKDMKRYQQQKIMEKKDIFETQKETVIFWFKFMDNLCIKNSNGMSLEINNVDLVIPASSYEILELERKNSKSPEQFINTFREYIFKTERESHVRQEK